MGATPELGVGLPTIPGSSPAPGVAEAVELAVRDRPVPVVAVPADARFSLLAQAASAFEGVHPLPDGGLVVSEPNFALVPAAAASTQAPCFAPLQLTLDRWPELRATGAPQLLRVEMTGPVSLALALRRAGVAQAEAMEAARVASVCRAEALVARVRSVEPALALAVVMDERGLIGSMHPTFPLSVRQVRSLLDPVVDAIDRAAGDSAVLIGAHVPGRSDWHTIISSGVSLLSIPTDSSAAGWARSVQALLDNGGWIAWGALPVDRPLGTGEELLWRRLLATWRDLEAAGVDGVVLRQRSLVGPADGLARFDVAQLGQVVDLVDALSARVAALGTTLPASTGS